MNDALLSVNNFSLLDTYQLLRFLLGAALDDIVTTKKSNRTLELSRRKSNKKLSKILLPFFLLSLFFFVFSLFFFLNFVMSPFPVDSFLCRHEVQSDSATVPRWAIQGHVFTLTVTSEALSLTLLSPKSEGTLTFSLLDLKYM